MHHSSMSWEITLLYFFNWNCTWFGKKDPSKCKISDFWLLTFLAIDCFCWKYINVFAKNVQRSYVSLLWKLMQNLKKNWSVVWWILTQALESLKIFHFHWFLFCNVLIVWPKNVQTWHWRGMQNLKKNWSEVWKMTWGIWQVFTRGLGSQNWDFDGIL